MPSAPNLNWIANFIWGIADDVLRDVYVRGKYRDVILPMVVIRRLDAVLEPTKSAVLQAKAQMESAGIANFENELSFHDWDAANSGYPCRDRQHAREAMGALISTLRETSRFPSIRPELRTQFASLEYPLSESYNVTQWRNDPEVNRDEQRLFRLRTTIAFSLEDYLAPNTMAEATVFGRAGFGLAAAWLLDGICLSLASHEIWNRSVLDAQITKISEDEDTVLPVAIRHAAQPGHVAEHAPWLQSRPGISLRNGADLLAHAPAAFPNVEFGLTAKKEIGTLTGNERHFRWVIECLDCASREIRAWRGGQFPHRNLPGPATGESLSVRQSDRLMNMRKFPAATGEILQFEHHMKARGSNMRLYYRAETDRGVVVIGTLCDHLETSRY